MCLTDNQYELRNKFFHACLIPCNQYDKNSLLYFCIQFLAYCIKSEKKSKGCLVGEESGEGKC